MIARRFSTLSPDAERSSKASNAAAESRGKLLDSGLEVRQQHGDAVDVRLLQFSYYYQLPLPYLPVAPALPTHRGDWLRRRDHSSARILATVRPTVRADNIVNP